MNLLDMVKGQLTQTVIGQLGKAVNLSPTDVSKAMDVIVPAQMSVLAQHGATTQGAQGLLGLLGNFGGLGNIAGLLGAAGGAGSLLKIGEAVLPALLGGGTGKLPGILGGLASVTGLGQGALGGLMNLALPMILGQLGSHVKTTGMDAKGLGGLLGGLQGIIGPMLPAGLSSALNLGSAAGTIGAVPNLGGLISGASGLLGGVGGAAGTAAVSSIGAAVGHANAQRGGIPWLPILGALAVGGLGWFFFGRGGSSTPATPTTTVTTPTTTDTATPTSTSSDTAAACDAEYTLNATDGSSVTEPFQFGGTGKGKGYNITVYQEADGRKIGSKDLPNDASCKWGYLSKPTKGKIKYEVREIGGTEVLSTVTLNVQ